MPRRWRPVRQHLRGRLRANESPSQGHIQLSQSRPTWFSARGSIKWSHAWCKVRPHGLQSSSSGAKSPHQTRSRRRQCIARHVIKSSSRLQDERGRCVSVCALSEVNLADGRRAWLCAATQIEAAARAFNKGVWGTKRFTALCLRSARWLPSKEVHRYPFRLAVRLPRSSWRRQLASGPTCCCCHPVSGGQRAGREGPLQPLWRCVAVAGRYE